MKRYVIEETLTPNSLNDKFPQGYKESYIRKGNYTVKATTFFRSSFPEFWPEYLYTSKELAEKSMKIMMKYSQEKYWDTSFRIVEVEIN